MDLSFEQLKSMVVFASIVEHGSFSSASRVLDISRASVSYHIKKLEQQLGVTLFYRSTRSISLTDAGQRYYKRCAAVVEEARLAQQDMESFKLEPKGKLKITCPEGVGAALIAPIVSEFKQQHAKVDIELILTDRVINLVAEGVDVGIRGAASPMRDSDLQSIKLPPHSMCLCASPAYLQQHGWPSIPADLHNHQWVIYTASSTNVVLSKTNKSVSVTMEGSVETNHAYSRTQFVLDGHGLGKLPMYVAAPFIADGSLQCILQDYSLAPVELYAVFPAGAARQKKLRLFLDHLKRRMLTNSEQGLM